MYLMNVEIDLYNINKYHCPSYFCEIRIFLLVFSRKVGTSWFSHIFIEPFIEFDQNQSNFRYY